MKQTTGQELSPHVDVGKRQEPLKERYRARSQEAVITDYARTIMDKEMDAVHGLLNLGRSEGGAQIGVEYAAQDDEEYGVEWPTGIHRAVGGDHDLPNPGNILSAALAVCFDSTLRMIANILEVELDYLSVTVSSTADVRGTLVVDRDVPVEFQEMVLHVDLKTEKGTPPRLIAKLLKAAEYSCVNLQTLRKGVPVEMEFDVDQGTVPVQSS
jgi:uncharacterized OsmC-like protein